MTHKPQWQYDGLCPLCRKPLLYLGGDPTCTKCVIDGKRDELHIALHGKKGG